MNLNNVILCPSNLGQLKKGVKFFPKMIKNYIKPNFKVINLNLNNNIFDSSKIIYDKCLKQKKNICIGGDHSISIASGAASLSKHKNTKFIWIDAHADINTLAESKTKNFHGMPLAYLTGIDKNIKFDFIKNHLPFKNLLYIGLRDIDNFEYSIIQKKNIKMISHENINLELLNSYQNIKDFIKNDPVHISFDVDSIDPEYISSTGTIVMNGLELKPAKKLLSLLLENHNVICMDIVEMNMEINSHEYNKSLNNFRFLFSKIIN